MTVQLVQWHQWIITRIITNGTIVIAAEQCLLITPIFFSEWNTIIIIIIIIIIIAITVIVIIILKSAYLQRNICSEEKLSKL